MKLNMLFPQLEKYRGRGAKSTELLIQATHFLNDIWSESINLNESPKPFNYKMFASKCSINKEPALAVLNICEVEYILKSSYIFYCPETEGYIDEFDSLKLVPKFIECEYHDRIIEHESIHCPVDIMFQFTNAFLKNLEEYLY